ncbi:hypothetical protein JAAARDRAFT_86685, partial [Jaapia argillacea MUCL 33604]
LHPAYKLSYFCEMKWQESWIKEAIDVVQEEWEAKYKPTITLPLPAPVNQVCFVKPH